MEPGLHAALRRAAKEADVSLNEYCSRRLAAPSGGAEAVGAAAGVVRRAAALLGEELVGLVAYGSYARGEAEDTSDVDVLIVVERSVRLTRELYRRWDEAPLDWEGRRVDPHFAHPPKDSGLPSGLWAEIAIEGIVLFERGLALSRALVRIRRDILAGRIARRVVHGQPYWAEVS